MYTRNQKFAIYKERLTLKILVELRIKKETTES